MLEKEPTSLPQFVNNPFRVQLSFHKLIERYEDVAATDDGYYGQHAKIILADIASVPELKTGITDVSQITQNSARLGRLVAELFPPALVKNEIKAISVPYLNFIVNPSERFKAILNDAGEDFDINIRGLDSKQFFIASCCLILNRFYSTSLDPNIPLFYDIPTANGIMKHYRILYNADFIEIIPTAKAPKLTQTHIELLTNNYDDFDLWKKTFPVGGWLLKGFSLMTLVDVTTENAVSNLKSTLLKNTSAPDFQQSLEAIFKSIFRLPEMRIGFTSYNHDDHLFTSRPFGQRARSYMLAGLPEYDAKRLLGLAAYHTLVKSHNYLAVADLDDFTDRNPDSTMGRHFRSQNVRSFIMAPVIKDDKLLGVFELMSPGLNEFNSVNAHRLEMVMPAIVDTIDRRMSELDNRIQAVIQNNYTTLHPSVDWKFKREAQNYIHQNDSGSPYSLKEVVFKNVYPLYGQTDIKDSSVTRNESVKADLINQLNELIYILDHLHQSYSVAAAGLHLIEVKRFVSELTVSIKADTEQAIQRYLELSVHPLLKSGGNYGAGAEAAIYNYFNQIDTRTGEFHAGRRSYELTLSLINDKFADILDKRQADIQTYFPHYFERFKTDGIEHNAYIGESISPGHRFNIADLNRLRLWQLMLTAEMDMEQHNLKDNLPYPLEVASLILAFSAPIAIRFRMDEKHFDVDGAYNVRYEVMKKRIDKALINGTSERITRQGSITIVYSKPEEAAEYRNYISLLQARGVLEHNTADFEIEDLQGVSGLRALRVSVVHQKNLQLYDKFFYDELYHQLTGANTAEAAA